MSPDHRIVEGTVKLKTMWHKGTLMQSDKEQHGSPVGGEGDGVYGYNFQLQKGVDWDECATDVSIPVIVTDDKGKTVFEAKKLYRQDCPVIPVSPPVGTKPKPPALDKATWGEGAVNDLPADARGLTQRFIDAAVDVDPPRLATFTSAGVKKGKRVLKGADVYDFEKVTGIRPQKQCDENQKNCHWGPWQVIKKTATEFWIYSDSDSGYGTFACAVFSKRGASWVWTAVRTYDTGEP